MNDSHSSPQLRFRLLLGRSTAIGPGKADLLAAIAESGSISAAGRSMGMSYKKAWYLIDDMNRSFCEPVVTARKGGTGHGGASLTPMGEKVLAMYRAIEAKAALAVAADLERFAELVVEPSFES